MGKGRGVGGPFSSLRLRLVTSRRVPNGDLSQKEFGDSMH